jgi:nucleoid-associated protein EbfC
VSSSEGPGIDFGSLLSQLGEMQQNLRHAQESAAAQVVEGSAGGGAVKIRATGGLDVQQVTIDPSVVDPGDVEMLQDLVLAAVRDTIERAGTLTSGALGDIGLGGEGGIDLGGALGGLLGQ